MIHLSDLELDNALNYNTSKLIILKSVTKGTRNYTETMFETQLLGMITSWYKRVIDLFEKYDILGKALEQSKYFKSQNLDRESKQSKADGLSKVLFSQYSEKFIEIFPKKPLIRIWRAYSHKQYRAGIKASADSLGIDLQVEETIVKDADTHVFRLTDAEIVHTINNRAVEYSDSLIEHLIDDARVLIRDRIYLGTDTADDVANILQDMYKLPYWRILNVARTEAQAAFGLAQFNFYERSGVRRKHWEDVGDGRVRKQHKANTAQGWIPIDATFSSGQKHTGDGPLSNNCRCIIVPDLSDPSIVLKPWLGGSIR
jgi:hypothetical protein